MAKYFLMSKRFNKKTAEDFGLIRIDNQLARLPNDGSLWEKTILYDFGWGEENGYYKIPLPSFEHLMNIILSSDDEEDVFGSAAIVLKNEPEKLLIWLENNLFDKKYRNSYQMLVKLFRLDNPLNRSSTIGKDIAEVNSDYLRWKSIAERIKQK